MRIEKQGSFFKADGKLIYGWALVCEQKNADGAWEPYVDTQGDHIPEDVMVEAALDFAKNSRVGKDMHAGDQVANVPFVYVVTKASNSLGLATDKTGMLIGWEPDDPALLDAVAKGERTGFSIGGFVLESDHEIGKVAKSATAAKADEKSPRVFRRFEIAEISLVDMPAMEGATIGYVKRADGTARRVIAKREGTATAKRAALTAPTLGHTHLVHGFDDMMAGTTSYESMYVDGEPHDHYTGHCHPWIRAEDGSVTLGEAMGHTHAIGAMSATLAKAAPVEKPNARTTPIAAPTAKSTQPTNPSKVDSMKLVVLTEAQHAHYSKLAGEDAEAFLAKSHADRDAIVEKALAADPVVFKGEASGIEVRKSHGDLALQLAKQNETLAKQAKEHSEALAKEREGRLVELYEKRATSELGNIAGTTTVKVAMLRAIDTIADKDTRDAALLSLKSADAFAKEAGTAKGANPGDGPKADSPIEKFNAKLVEFAKSKNLTPVEATTAFVETSEGAALYDDLIAAQR